MGGGGRSISLRIFFNRFAHRNFSFKGLAEELDVKFIETQLLY